MAKIMYELEEVAGIVRDHTHYSDLLESFFQRAINGSIGQEEAEEIVRDGIPYLLKTSERIPKEIREKFPEYKRKESALITFLESIIKMKKPQEKKNGKENNSA